VTKLSDQAHLLTDQYRDAANLNARIQLHLRFSTNKYGWQRWTFDQLDLASESRVLELGCGPGHLWLENLHRLPEGWNTALSDLSLGMVEEARQNLRDSRHPFAFAVVDAQAIPFEDESFDAVIANHMLYHVPNRARAFAEIRRVLKRNGRLYTSTVGRSHMQELNELVSRFDPDVDSWGVSYPNPFVLENGREQLAKWFQMVTLHRYEDSLAITEAGPLVDYVMSTARSLRLADKRAQFTEFVEQELALHDAIHVTKDAGLFEAFRSG